MWTLVVILNVLSSLACVAVASYGVPILMLTRFDPLRADYLGTAFGLGLLATSLIIPGFCVVTSLIGGSTSPFSILLALPSSHL
jgi:hypothetical protein